MTEEETITTFDGDGKARKVHRHGGSWVLTIPERYLRKFGDFMNKPLLTIEYGIDRNREPVIIIKRVKEGKEVKEVEIL